MPRKYNYTKKTGRPSKFKKRYIADMIKFFSIDPERKEVMETLREVGKDGEVRKMSDKFKYVPNKFPTISKFAQKIGVEYRTVLRWAEEGLDDTEEIVMSEGEVKILSVAEQERQKDLQQFCHTYKRCKVLQKDFLIQIGLSGAAPSAAFIFTAKNVTDMRDKVESEVSHRIVKPLLENLQLDPALMSDNTINTPKLKDGSNSQ